MTYAKRFLVGFVGVVAVLFSASAGIQLWELGQKSAPIAEALPTLLALTGVPFVLWWVVRTLNRLERS